MGDLIDETMKRTRQYWYVDGISEMFTGLFILLLGAFFAVIPLIPSVAARTWLLALGQPALILLGFWLGGKAVRAVKERLTYPRTGYLAFRKPTRKHRWGRLVFAAVLSASLGVLFSVLFNLIPERWIPAIAAGVLGLFMLFLAYQLGLVRFAVLAGYFLVVGLLVFWWMP
ncbi:MAG TPA: hypothetical protein VFF68_13740, partial [Anaerolineaceae bacterium]|nr:hypothetical protein [Anaerolineaceae bacterium]